MRGGEGTVQRLLLCWHLCVVAHRCGTQKLHWLALCRNFLYGKRGGRFLELGAYNGCTFSNTLLLEAGAGWRVRLQSCNRHTVSLVARPGRYGLPSAGREL